MQMKQDLHNYDVIICGTSIMHGILARLLSYEGKRVFQLDKNDYYAGEGRSVLSISDLWRIFRPNQKAPANLEFMLEGGLDFVPKLILSNGKLIKILAKLKALSQRFTRRQLKYIDDNLIINSKNEEKIVQIPSIEQENRYFQNEEQKINYQKFLEFVYDQQDQNLNKINFNDLANKFNLDKQSQHLLGRGLAFQLNDDYLNQPANLTIQKIKLYLQSKNKKTGSTFIYPKSGLDEYIFDAVYMTQITKGGLHIDVNEILFDEQGQVSGIKSNFWNVISGSDQINAPIIIADPSYANKFQDRLNSMGKIIRCICILNHSIPGYDDKSLSILIPAFQTGRKNDIYITMLGYSHQICVSGYQVCVISTNIETNDPEQELETAFQLINPVEEKFITISDWYVQDDWKNNLYFTNSYNATNVLDTEVDQILDIYKKLTGKELDLNNLEEMEIK